MPSAITPIDARSWQPTPGAKSFNGKAIPATVDLFVQPPPEIGPVVGAESEVKVGQTLWSLPVKIALALIVMLVDFGIAAVLVRHDPGETKVSTPQVIVILTAITVPILGLALAFKPKYMSYIGQDGAAVFWTRGSRSAATGQHVRFADVANIELATISRRKGWLEWQMRFVTDTGERLMTLKGSNKTFAGRLIKSPIYIISSVIAETYERRTGRKPLTTDG